MAGRVLVFGCNGFVGAYVAREFADSGYEVCGSDVAPTAGCGPLSGYRAADITDPDAVRAAVDGMRPDVIVNLAAISSVGASWKAPQLTMSVNVNGALNVLEAARALGDAVPRVLLVGSSEEYAPSTRPLREDDPIDATNPYGISKAAQERFARLYCEKLGVPVYFTRSFNHTGPGQTLSFVLPSWCKQAADIQASGAPGVLRVGNVDVERDFSDVRDVARAYRLLVESDCAGEAFNIGSGHARKLRDLAGFIAGLASQDVRVEVDPALLRPSDNPFICCDCAKARERLGWVPQRDVRETLAEMFEAFSRPAGEEREGARA